MDVVDYGTIWVCVCCMLVHANGECCARDDAHKPARDERGRFTGDTILGDSYPLSRVRPPFRMALGMRTEEHSCVEHTEDDPECEAGTCDCERADECDCERQTYSTSQCEGCGSYLHGERHAMWLYKEKRSRKVRN